MRLSSGSYKCVSFHNHDLSSGLLVKVIPFFLSFETKVSKLSSSIYIVIPFSIGNFSTLQIENVEFPYRHSKHV